MNNEQRTIPVDQILKPRISLRPVRRKAPEYVELVESVKKDGVLQPILVRSKEDKYEIVEGWHRYEAALEAGLNDMPCIIKDLTDQEVLILQLKCNAIRPKTASFEYARRLKILMEQGFTLAELSSIIDKSPAWIRDQIQLNRLCEEAREPVERGEINLSSALALANLPTDIQSKFVDDAISMKSVEFVPRAKTALRDFKSYLLQLREENKKFGAVTPELRATNAIKQEALKPKHAKEVLKAVKAKTPLDGWNACLSWIFKIDPVTVENRINRRQEIKNEHIVNREEFRKTNQELIEKFVKHQSRTGDYKHG
jgi:ParB/RepB/Spo0J family partition protein